MSRVDNLDNRPFKDIRVYIISSEDGFDFRGKELAMDYQAIMDEAEDNGLVYTLEEFQAAVNDQEVDNLSTNWILIR